MVVKIFYFVIAIFSVALVFLFSSDPYFAEQFKLNSSIANMQANNIVDYEINSTKISGVYKGAEMNRYAKVDVVNNFDSVFLRGKQTHYMRSDKANLQGDIIKFVSNAKYENNESMVFSSQEILYNKKNKTISSKVPFVATQNTDKITGKSADYDLNKKQLSAKGIKAWIEQER